MPSFRAEESLLHKIAPNWDKYLLNGITVVRLYIGGGHISIGKFQSGFLKKHIIFPDCICFPGYKKKEFCILTQGNESSGHVSCSWGY